MSRPRLPRAFLDGVKQGSRKDGTRTETEIKQAILQYLAARRIYAWSVNVGAAWMPGKGGKMQLVRFNKKGQPDIAGVVKALGGKALYIEVKRPGENPEPHQEGLMNVLRREGALVFVARSVADTAQALDEAGIPDL